MSGTTISVSTSVGVSLTTPSQNPLVVTDTASVDVSSGNAVYGSNAYAWSVYNAGLLNAASSTAIDLTAGGTVTNAVSGLISGSTTGVILGAAGSAANEGTILGGSVYGIDLSAGGMVTNAASALIQGFVDGVITGGTATMVNSGTIVGPGFAAVEVATGSVTNTGTGTISGPYGIVATAESTVVNQGLITGGGNPSGAGFGVYLGAGGIVTNAASAVIDSHYLPGIYVETGGGTVINAGTIIGRGAAVDFNDVGPNLLQIDPGAVFSGAVEANANGIGNTLDLAAGGTTGTIYGLGSQYTGFGIVNVAAGASWQMTGTNNLGSGSSLTNYGALTLSSAALTDTGGVVNDSAISLDPSTMTLASLTGTGLDTIIDTSTLTVTGEVSVGQTIAFSGSGGDFGIGDLAAMAGTISGWGTTGTIDLTSETYGNVTNVTITTGNVLQVTDTGGTYNLQLDPEQNFNGLFAHQSQDSTADTELMVNDVPCFLRGTAIQTPRGEVTVEHLAVGDTVVTVGGARRRLVWIGTGQVLVTRGQRSAATPIIVRKGALASNVPNRDLRITKGHSLYLDGVLIPAEFLINHRSILWDDTARVVTIYHLELDTHDVMLANGVPAESYRDDGNRWLFQNANTGWNQPPKPPCAPVLTGGPIVEAIWRRLLDRSGPRPGIPLTEDPDLHVLAGGQLIKGRRTAEATYRFDLPARPGGLRIVSRAGTPAEVGLARDFRQLGVAVRQIALWQGTRLAVLEASDPRLEQGFHAYEPENGWRWTDGDATLPATLLAGFDGPTELMLLLGGRMRYPVYGVPRLDLAG
jgi:hypothetical protein